MTQPLSTTELIDDRELEDWEGDRFRHQDVASQLAELVASAKTPANIALYGPWGSGKTGVANLLQARLTQSDFKTLYGEIGFARFDAFKYAEIPLRRHFLSQMALRLLPGKEAEEFRRSLYQSEGRTDIDFKALDVWRAVKVFVGILVVGLFLAVVAAAATAAIATAVSDSGDQDFWDRTRIYFSGVIGFSFAPAAVLAGLFAIAGKSLPVTRTREIPSTDEEFERKFRDLLKDSGLERLVVFIDELDRCPPNRVVDVLDTVRTFLDVENTVFIVAADQHVLEQALTLRVQQTTPPDPTNPYYSSGSAYLDKVFHYQLSLPSLLPGRITRYAVELVEGRPGVWANSTISIPWVISVLIPTHVRSPRRVKTLLNNFVLTFRLAQQRFAAGHLSSDPADRALELAKLVTLRTEFPSFARELTLSSRLPELFMSLAIDRDATKPSEVSDEVWEKAAAFVDGDLAIDELLHQRNTLPQVTRADFGESDEARQDLGGSTAVAGNENVSGDEDGLSEREIWAAVREPGAALRLQLHHYLLKTKQVPNPRRDLIFLEGQGHLFGIDESLAEEIEDAAIGGRNDEVASTVDEQDSEMQVSLIRLLSQRTREAFPGVEGDNLVQALLTAVANRPDDVLDKCADEVVDAVTAHLDMGDLAPDQLPGAFVLGLRSDRAGSDELVEYVLSRDEALEDAGLGILILAKTDSLSDEHVPRVAEVAAELLAFSETARQAVGALHGLTHRSRLMAPAEDRLLNIYQSAVELEASSDADGETGETSDDLAISLQEAIEEALTQQAGDILNLLITASLQAESPELWSAAGQTFLDTESPDLDESTKAVILARAGDLQPTEASEWLALLPDEFADTPDRHAHVDKLVSVLWDHRGELGPQFDSHDEQLLEAMGQVKRIQQPGSAAARSEVTGRVVSTLGTAATTITEANALAVTWGHLGRFTELELLPPDTAADAVGELLINMLRSQAVTDGADGQFHDFLTRWSLWTAGACSEQTAMDLTEAIAKESWVPTPTKESLALRVASRCAKRHDGLESPYSAEEVARLAETHVTAIRRGLAAWVETYARTPSAVYAVIEPFISRERYDDIASAARTYAQRAERSNLDELAALELAASNGRRISTDFLRDVRFHEAADIAGADLIVAGYKESATNNDRRRDLLDAWSVLQPTSPTARQRLIDNVTLPMLKKGGKKAFDHVKSRMALIANPVERKNALRDALRKAAGGKDKDKKLESLMLEHGITIQKRKGIFGLTKQEIDEE